MTQVGNGLQERLGTMQLPNKRGFRPLSAPPPCTHTKYLGNKRGESTFPLGLIQKAFKKNKKPAQVRNSHYIFFVFLNIYAKPTPE